MDSQALFTFLYVSYNLGVYIKFFADLDNSLCYFGIDVNLHSVAHVEYLIHFFPICARAVMDGFKQWRYGEHVVFDHFAIVVHEVEHLDRKSTRLNSSHANISYAVFCLKKKQKD